MSTSLDMPKFDRHVRDGPTSTTAVRVILTTAEQ